MIEEKASFENLLAKEIIAYSALEQLIS